MPMFREPCHSLHQNKERTDQYVSRPDEENSKVDETIDENAINIIRKSSDIFEE